MNIRKATERVINTHLNINHISHISYGDDHAVIVDSDEDAVIITFRGNPNLPVIHTRYIGTNNHFPDLYPTVEDAHNALPPTALVFHASVPEDHITEVLGDLTDISGFVPLKPLGDCGMQWGEEPTSDLRHIMAAILPAKGDRDWSMFGTYHQAESVTRNYRGIGQSVTALSDWSMHMVIS